MTGPMLLLAAHLLPAPAHARDLPTARVSWDRHAVELSLDAPEGHHLADDFPATVQFGSDGQGWSGPGAALAEGIRFLRPQDAVAGIIEVGLCEDTSGTCAPQRLAFAGELRGRRGRDLTLATRAVARPGETDGVAHASSLEAALDQAATEGRRVLLDFTAVWCPPCNLLAAEVLHDPADAGLFEDLILVEVDVDDFASWPIKDAYDVGGYPTLIVVDASGAELDRLVGYPGEAAFVSWLQSTTDQAPLGALPDPAEMPGTRAAEMSIRLCGVDRTDDAMPFLERAEAAEDTSIAQLNIARLLVRNDGEAASWLAMNATVDPTWVWTAWTLARADASLADRMIGSMRKAVASVDAVFAADLLYAMAGLHEAHGRPDLAPDLYAAAAATLQASFTGNPDLDRGHWTFLARLRASAGDIEGATELLRDAARRFPDEMTFPYALAGILLDADDPHAAIEAALQARAVAYGDNALRVANRLAKAQAAAGDVDAARATLEAALQDAPSPGDARVRTGRYIDALRETLDGLSAD